VSVRRAIESARRLLSAQVLRLDGELKTVELFPLELALEGVLGRIPKRFHRRVRA
jgi:hypothetical protein